MTKVAHLKVGKQYAAYNQAVRKALEAINVAYTEVSTKYGYCILVAGENELVAAKAVLSVPFKR